MAESPTELIRRALSELEANRGSTAGEVKSPGMKEAVMAAEHNHQPSRGNTKTNDAEGRCAYRPVADGSSIQFRYER